MRCDVNVSVRAAGEERLGKVRVEVLLPVELGMKLDFAIEGEAHGHGPAGHLLVEDRKRTWEPHAHGADVPVADPPKGHGAAAESLRGGAQLHVRLHPHDHLPFPPTPTP